MKPLMLLGLGLLMTLAASALLLSACSQNGTGSAPSQAGAPSGEAAVPVSANFTPFSSTVPQVPENTQCSLDLINNQASSSASVPSGSTVIFGGWAGNGHGQAAEGFVLVLRGKQNSYSAPFVTGVTRSDVAKAWNSTGMTESGYNLAAKLTGVAEGTYALYIADPTNAGSYCDLHRTVTVQ